MASSASYTIGVHSMNRYLQIIHCKQKVMLAIVCCISNTLPHRSPMKDFGTMRLKDIAEKLNVSISTVSRALGKETSDKVAPDLRAKIRETARQANYVPHPAAQLMRKPKVHLITSLLPFETGAFVSEFYVA